MQTTVRETAMHSRNYAVSDQGPALRPDLVAWLASTMAEELEKMPYR